MRRLISITAAVVTAASLASVAATQSAAARPAQHPAKAGPHSVAATIPAAQRAKIAGLARTAQARKAAADARARAQAHPHLTAAAAALPAAADGTVRVTVTGKAATVAATAKSFGGRALGAYAGQSSVLIAKSKLAQLSDATGITLVAPQRTPHVLDGPSEGVAASGASNWITAGNTGAGTKIAVVDIGFTNAAQEVTAGHLAANQADAGHLVNTDCTVNGSPSVNVSQHGTAVAEIVHQMAPSAELFLICVGSNVGFGEAATAIINYNTAHPTARITIATSSLGFTGDSRGDGSGDPSSTAAAVAAARKAGVLWIQSAGNQAGMHWGGTLTDNNANGYVDLHIGTAKNLDDDVITLEPGNPGAEVDFQWDEWPTSSAHLTLVLVPFTCTSTTCTQNAAEIDLSQDPVTTPLLPALVPANNSSDYQFYDVSVRIDGSYPQGARFDIDYFGTYGLADSACPETDSQDNCLYIAPPAIAESISGPAFSPYALAVGAHYVGDTTTTDPEWFSSQGPTIDGRVKPDITGYDGVSSWLPDFNTADNPAFYGTSAAAPHVAGAAALVQAENPGWDASQLQNFLEQRANNSHPTVPPTNATGAGLLTLGAPNTSALPADGQYQKLATPQRILDTRNTTGGHNQRLTTGTQVTVHVPAQFLPAGATAIAINLTGIKASRNTFLSVYPGGTAWPHTSNLNLIPPGDATAAVFAIVSVGAGNTIVVRNQLGLVDVAVDEVGYFTTNAVTGGLFTAQAANRVLDTRNTTGGHPGKLASNATVTVDPSAPSGATAAIVNVTATGSQTTSGFLAAAPACSKTTSTLNFGSYTRANLAIVGLAPNGTFCIANGAGAVDVVVDVLGFMSTSGAAYVGLPSPKRIMDTRTGNGPVIPPYAAAGHQEVITGAGVGEVPYAFDGGGSPLHPAGTTALFTGVTEASSTGQGYLQAFAGNTRPASPASTLNFTPGRIVPNAAVIGVDQSGQLGVFNSFGNTAIAVDLFGYFHQVASG